MTDFHHYGLFFSQAQLERAPQHQKKAPFASALDLLHTPHADPTSDMLLNGYRYRLGDETAGESGTSSLISALDAPIHADFLAEAQYILTLGQTLELLRTSADANPLISRFADRASALVAQAPEAIHHTLWRGVVMLALGTITEDDAKVQAGVMVYRDAIDMLLHPEGYMPRIVEYHNEATSFTYQFQATQALVLMAEIAKHIGIDLYPYHKRGVSVMTAAAYPLYYYFYPEKWLWTGDKQRISEGVSEDTAKALFKDNAGFLEIIANHYQPPLKAHQMLFDDLRPIFDPSGGGLTTLTHAPAPRKGLFG